MLRKKIPFFSTWFSFSFSFLIYFFSSYFFLFFIKWYKIKLVWQWHSFLLTWYQNLWIFFELKIDPHWTGRLQEEDQSLHDKTQQNYLLQTCVVWSGWLEEILWEDICGMVKGSESDVRNIDAELTGIKRWQILKLQILKFNIFLTSKN